jgi:cholesterol transport system auxiliary component
MVSFMLIRDMRQTELFTAISSPGKRYPATHVLEGSVDDFFEDDSTHPGEAVIHVTITLLHDTESDITKAVLFQKKYSESQLCHENTPQAFAEAMSRAMRIISRQIVVDTYDILAEQSGSAIYSREIH